MTPAIEEERALRKRIWEQLLEAGGPSGVKPRLLTQLGIYGGAQGIWVDKVARTGKLTPEGQGITVGLLHTGSSYADDLSDMGVRYHYPKTTRRGKDESEIAATKACKNYGVPLFVISHSNGGRTRDVRVGWVESWNDVRREFLVTFAEDVVFPSVPPSPPASTDDEVDWRPRGRRKRNTQTADRSNQTRFRYYVANRHGMECAVCPVAVDEVLEAAHIIEVQDGGPDHPANGLMFCVTHHRAYDRGLFTVKPGTTELVYSKKGPSKSELRITRDDLSHLKRPPAHVALERRFEKWAGD